MAHANWMNGKEMKKAAMMRTGLWITRRAHPGDAGASGAIFGEGSKQQSRGDMTGNFTCVDMKTPLQ